MTDEPRQDEAQPETSATVTEPTPESPPDEAAAAETPLVKLTQTVEIRDVGPCKKHIKVTVDRVDIDRLLNDKFKDLVGDASVAGFRPGKAPRKIVEKRFQKEVG